MGKVKPNVLLTGATGFVGVHLLDVLLQNKDIGDIYLLCRNIDQENKTHRIEEAYKKFSLDGIHRLKLAKNVKIIEGDITLPRSGINNSDYKELCSEVDVIYHIAARVNHIRPYEVLKAPNVDSLNDMINIANTGKMKVINFVSTLGSASRIDEYGYYVEDFPGSTILNSDMGYLISKWEAERLLGKFTEIGGKANLFRLGYISGHSKTGAAIFADNQFMLFIKSCIQLGYAPILPRIINFTPIDYTVSIMALPKYMTETGNVLNLFNYNGLISWEDIITWLNNRGFSLKLLNFYKWQKKLLDSGENNSLYRFLPLYGVDGSHDKILRFGREIDKFHYEKTKEATSLIDYKLPNLRYDLLDTYLKYLQKEDFLPVPMLNTFS
ncbi:MULTISPECIES: thioester reductase domain-containing protein [Xenorhabdus]|uniref:thioester reductase domain-containing protein n=1 Tax=Xenorhabdus TaxID=626 RepID=UPI000645FC57|nr:MULTISPECIES: thioester reductase domain-containing protein [Xenorhabdus]MBC8946587.1 peptide synthetase [Xenorhabdus indica]